MKRILFFDSGIGGLSVLEAVQKVNPDPEIYYLFDHAGFPYGDKPAEVVVDRCLKLVLQAIDSFAISLVVIACNTASTVALPSLREHLSIPVVGVVPAIKPAALHSHNKTIGILATPATIHRAYTNELIARFASDCQVIKVGSTRLVHLCEERLCGREPEPGEIAAELKPFVQAAVIPDVVVLGCTHFPWVRDLLTQVLPDTEFIDSGNAIGRRVRYVISNYETADVSASSGPRAFFTGKGTEAELAQYRRIFQSRGFASLETFGSEINFTKFQ